MPQQHAVDRRLASGNEAVARAAFHAGIKLGTGYPGTPSTEILELFDGLGGQAQWAPNEKVALEVGIGAAFAGARALVTMKHVGLNVAADPLFTVAYTGVAGGLVIVFGRRSGHGLEPERAGQPPLCRRRGRADAGAVRFAGSLRFHATRLRAFRALARAGPAAHDHAGVPLEATVVQRRLSRTAGQTGRFRARHSRPRDDSRLRAARAPAAARKAGGDCSLERQRGTEARSSRAGAPWASSPPASPSSTCARPRPRRMCSRLGLTYPLPIETMRTLRRQRRALPGRRRRRSLPLRGRAHRGHRRRKQAGDVPLRRAERRARASHRRGRHLARGCGCARQTARALSGLPAPQCLRGLARPRLHRFRRHRLLLARRPAAVLPPWTRWYAWAPPSAWAWACATSCRPSRLGAWSA